MALLARTRDKAPLATRRAHLDWFLNEGEAAFSLKKKGWLAGDGWRIRRAAAFVSGIAQHFSPERQLGLATRTSDRILACR
jgi:hypothetical protein